MTTHGVPASLKKPDWHLVGSSPVEFGHRRAPRLKVRSWRLREGTPRIIGQVREDLEVEMGFIGPGNAADHGGLTSALTSRNEREDPIAVCAVSLELMSLPLITDLPVEVIAIRE